MSTRATIVVKFGEEVENASSYFVKAELDESMNVDSKGETKSSFTADGTTTDPVYFLIQHDSRVQIKAIKSTNGQIQSMGQVSRTKKQQTIFTEINEVKDIGYMGSGVNVRCWGNQINGIGHEGLTGVKVTSGVFPAIADVKVGCRFGLFCLHAIIPALGEDEDYPVAIVIYMEVP
jgi:hypothetical protein